MFGEDAALHVARVNDHIVVASVAHADLQFWQLPESAYYDTGIHYDKLRLTSLFLLTPLFRFILKERVDLPRESDEPWKAYSNGYDVTFAKHGLILLFRNLQITAACL